MFSWQAVDLNDGKVVIFDESIESELRPEAIAASASIPLIFMPINIDDMSLVDGGVFANLNMGESVVRCREAGFEDKDIIVDTILIYEIVPTID
jgi:predicted acylesterase/phospholipase RssA